MPRYPDAAVFPVVLLLALAYLSGCATSPNSEDSKTKESRARGLLIRFLAAPQPDPPSPPVPPDPRYSEYFGAMKRQIEAVWVYPKGVVQQDDPARGVVVIVVRRNGTIARTEVTKTTGNLILDGYARNSVLLAAPFPPLPDEVKTETLTVSLNFSYYLGRYRPF